MQTPHRLETVARTPDTAIRRRNTAFAMRFGIMAPRLAQWSAWGEWMVADGATARCTPNPSLREGTVVPARIHKTSLDMVGENAVGAGEGRVTMVPSDLSGPTTQGSHQHAEARTHESCK